MLCYKRESGVSPGAEGKRSQQRATAIWPSFARYLTEFQITKSRNPVIIQKEKLYSSVQGDHAPRDGHVDSVQTSLPPADVAVRVEEEHVPLGRGRSPAGALEPVAARHEELAPPRVRAGDALGDGVLDVVLGVRVAVAAVEEDVVAVRGADDVGGLDQRAVLRGAVEDLDGAPDGGGPVADAHLLQLDGRGVDGGDPVVAVPAVADAVAIPVGDVRSVLITLVGLWQETHSLYTI